ncbi:MAG: ABC transporter substrate-binding protein [Lysobacteraceae bacterium]
MIRLMLGLLFAVSTSLAAAAEPADIVLERTRVVLDTIVEKRATFSQNPAALREFVQSQLLDVMDRPYSAQLVLARHARGASAEQIEAFAEALTDSLLRRYADALLEIDPGTDVRIAASTPMRDGQIVRVASRIVRRAGEPVQVDYMFRRKGDDWLVFDVIVEGISYVQTYRNQFDEQLRRRSLDEVIAALRSGELQVQG